MPCTNFRSDPWGDPVNSTVDFIRNQHSHFPFQADQSKIWVCFVSHPRYRDSPVFRATTRGVSELCQRSGRQRFFNKGTTSASMSYLEQIQVCDSRDDSCWIAVQAGGAHNYVMFRNWHGSWSNDTALVLLEACLADSSLPGCLCSIQ